jgi:hypothetical protein
MKYFRHLPLLGWALIVLVLGGVLTAGYVLGRDNPPSPVEINRLDLTARDLLNTTNLRLTTLAERPEADWDATLATSAGELRSAAESYTDAAAAPLLDLAAAIEAVAAAEPGSRRLSLNQALALLAVTRTAG